MTLDYIDFVILNELQKDAKQPVKKIAEKVGLSVTPIHERIRKLESSNVIEKYVAIVNANVIGKKLVAYCQVKLIKQQEDLYKRFEEYVVSFDEVLEAYYMAGSYDIMLKLLLEDMEEYQNFIIHKLSKLDIIANVQSAFTIRDVKKTNHIMLSEEEDEEIKINKIK